VEIDDFRNEENVLDSLREFLNDSMTDSLHVLEDEIDIGVQMKYFEAAREVKKNLNESETLAEKDKLFDDRVPEEEKRLLLNKLASVNSIEAFRTIEKYASQPDEGLKEWSKLACHESRMLIQSRLLDENQIFISTGLGGKSNKLRYFLVLFPNNGLFTSFQSGVVEKEFQYVFNKYDAVIEEVNSFDRYLTMMVLVPIAQPLRDLFMEAICECNQFGNFINERFIVTNVKRLEKEEILEIIQKD